MYISIMNAIRSGRKNNLSTRIFHVCTRKKRGEKRGEKKLQQQAVSGGETGEDDDVLQV